MPVSLSEDVFAACRDHAYATLPHEACGLLASTAKGDRRRCTAFVPLPNRARSATRFSMDPVLVLRALRSLRRDGLRLAGIFHSHPHTGARPSEPDLATARQWPGVAQVILGRPDSDPPELRAFDDRGGELPIHVGAGAARP